MITDPVLSDGTRAALEVAIAKLMAELVISNNIENFSDIQREDPLCVDGDFASFGVDEETALIVLSGIWGDVCEIVQARQTEIVAKQP